MNRGGTILEAKPITSVMMTDDESEGGLRCSGFLDGMMNEVFPFFFFSAVDSFLGCPKG